MSGDQAVAGVEERFMFVSTPQLDDEELSWQYGSSDSLSQSKYILVSRSMGVVKENIAETKTGVCGQSADTELVWELLAHGQQSLLSCVQKNVDHYTNIYRDKAFGGRTSQEMQEFDCSHVRQANRVWSIVSQNGWQPRTKGFSAQNGEEQLKLSLGSSIPASKYRETQWLLSEGLQCTPEFNRQHEAPKLVQGSMVIGFSLPEDGDFRVATEQPEKLGEALCHSQTRARNAEKLAVDAQIEKEQLAKLLFKETSTCRTYKERVHLLELENMRLKILSEHGTELPLPCYKGPEVKSCCKFYKKGMSKGASSVPGMIGLAFALGLSCASACFVIGCCMGLVGLSQ